MYLPIPLKSNQLSIPEMEAYEQSLMHIVTGTVKSLVPESLAFLRNRVTRAFNRFAEESHAAVNYETLDSVTISFIKNWCKRDKKIRDLYDNYDDKETFHKTVANIIIKNQMPTLYERKQILTKEMRFLCGMRSEEASPYRVSQRYIKPLKQRLDDVIARMSDFDHSAIDANEQQASLFQDISEVIHDAPEIISESMEEMVRAVDGLCDEFRKSAHEEASRKITV